MKAFYDYSLLITLSRMRALKTLRFLLKEDEAGNGLRYFETETPEKNADRFMFSVDCELAHVAEVVVEDPTVTNYGTVYGGALLRVVAALGDRNREWEMPRDVVEAFWGSFLGKEGGKWVR